MLFIPILLVGILFYFTDKRVWSALIFFFFIFEGFHLIPESLFNTGLVISKSQDFAILYIIFILILGFIKYKDFVPKNKISKGIGLFMLFILISIGVSKYIYGVGWVEIIRTSRIFFFVLCYFVFRRFTKKELLLTIKLLFYITTFLCLLYIIQSVIGRPLLAGASKVGTPWKINRYYNIPYSYYFFIPYSFFANPLRGRFKYISIAIYILVCVVSLHRGLMLGILVMFFIGIFYTQGGFKGFFKYMLIGSILILPFSNIIIDRFDDKTTQDIDNVMQGAFQEYGEDQSVTIDGTFLFRAALFYERFQYVIEKPIRMIFGVGFMSEGSDIAKNTFDFAIGLSTDDGSIVQLDTADIAWVLFFLRLGFVGTLLYLYLYVILGTCFWKQKQDRLCLASLLYIILLVFTTLTSGLLFYTYMIVFPIIIYIIKEREIQEEQDDNQLNAES